LSDTWKHRIVEVWKIPTQYTFDFDVGVRGKMTCSRVVRYLV
jgi:hypothetical protein